MHKCKRVSWRAPSSRRSYGDYKITTKRRVNWFHSFEWMARKLQTDIWRERKKIRWRSRWNFLNNSTTLDWTITRVVLGLWITKQTKLVEFGLFYKALPEKGLKPKQGMTVCSLLLLMTLRFFEQFLCKCVLFRNNALPAILKRCR